MTAKSFSRFFFFVFILIAGGAIFRWILLWNVAYSYMDEEFPYWMQQKDYVNAKSDKREAIFLGDSRMKSGVIPHEVSANAYNLALGGGTPIEMYYSLKKYLQNHPAPEKVILGFAPVHYASTDTFESRTLYFHFISFFEKTEAYIIGKITKTEKNLFREYLKYDLLFPQKYSAAQINSGFGREETNRREYQKCVDGKGYMLFGVKDFDDGLNAEANTKEFRANKRCEFYLKKIIALCEKENLPLFIEQLPMNQSSFNAINESGYYVEYQAYLKNFENGNVKIECEIPCYAPNFFGDSSHVNAAGAKRFSKEIKEKYF